LWQAFQHRELFVDLVAGTRYHDIHSEGGQHNAGACNASGDGNAAFVVPHVGVESERSTAWSSARATLGFDAGVTGADFCDLDNLGRTDSDAHFTMLSWSALYSFFLEPVIDPAGWEDPESPEDSTLAHEVALVFAGQYSSDRLVPQYQAVAGGFDTVRGAKQAEISGDTLVFGRAEYRLHVPRLFSPDATPPSLPLVGLFRTRPSHVFGMPDWDFVVRLFTDVANTIPAEQKDSESNETLWSIGTGVELQVLRNLILGVDVGHVLHGAEETDAGDTRAHLLATLLY
jgi:hemolysin activation/secretion protein